MEKDSTESKVKPMPASLRQACFGDKVLNTKWTSPIKRAKGRVALWFAMPILGLAISAIPWLPSTPIDRSQALTYLLTLWQVQGAVAGAAIVIFVFLLQTANLTRRTTSIVLNLALDAGILSASALSLSLSLGIGLVLAMAQGFSDITVPVLGVLVFGLAANVIYNLTVLLTSITYLSKSKMREIERRTLQTQIVYAVSKEIEFNVSQSWIIENLDGPRIVSWAHRLSENPGSRALNPDLTGKVVKDINLHQLDQIAQTMGKSEGPAIQVNASLGHSGAGDLIYVAANCPTETEKKILRCITWRRSRGTTEQEDLLDDMLEDIREAVAAGVFSRFKEGLDTCAFVIDETLSKLAEFGYAKDEGAVDMGPIRRVMWMLRFALEEALKSRRSDFALAAGRDLSDLADVAVRHRNVGVIKGIFSFYPFLRKVILELGLGSDSLYQDLCWRTLKEFAFTLPIDVKDDDVFVARTLSVLEDIFTQMLADSIQEGAQDLEVLLHAWLLTFQHAPTRRIRTSSRNGEVDKSQDNGGRWVMLAAWATHLAVIGQLDKKRFADALIRLDEKLESLASICSAAEEASAWDGHERELLSAWIYSTKLQELVHGIDERTPVVRAFVAMLLSRLAHYVDSEKPPHIAPSKAGAELSQGGLEVVAALRDAGSPLSKLFVESGLIESVNPLHLDGIESFLKTSAAAEDARKKTELAAKPLDQTMVDEFKVMARKAFVSDSFFRKMPEIAQISEKISPAPEGVQPIGITDLTDKRNFIPDAFTGERTAQSMGEMMARGEQRFGLEMIAHAATDRRHVEVGALADAITSLCRERGNGCLIIQGVGTRIDLYQNPDFSYRDSNSRPRQMGSLAGVPVFYGFEVTKFAALYLPPNSVRFQSQKVNEGSMEALDIEVKLIDAALASEIIGQWEQEGKRSFDTAEARKLEVLDLQSRVLVRLRTSPAAHCDGAIVFLADGSLDDEIAEDDPPPTNAKRRRRGTTAPVSGAN